MLKSETREIDGLRVTTTQLPARRAFKLAAKLIKYLAPALAGMQMSDELTPATLAPALSAMMSELDGDDIDKLIAEVLAGTYVIVPGPSGDFKLDLVTPDAIDRAFAGKLGSMLGVMRFAIEVNFADFFGAAGLNTRPTPTLSQ